MVSAVVGTLDRRAVVARLLRDRQGLLVVTGLGSPSYDVHAAGDHDGNYYLWGAMGAAALVGLGLAQAQPDRTVMVVTGDGEQLMGLGGLATIAIAAPANLVVVVLDNGHYGETGMQRSHTGFGLDLAAIAEAAGFVEAVAVTDPAGVDRVAQSIGERASGPRLYVMKIKAENVPRSLPPRDGVYLKNRLRAHLGFAVT
jgi:thiamine pyrophosphate-dependent acetolactate synthase large subunit-like protein